MGQGRERRSEFYSEQNTLSDAQRDAILSEVGGMREMLRKLQDDPDLEGRVLGGPNLPQRALRNPVSRSRG